MLRTAMIGILLTMTAPIAPALAGTDPVRATTTQPLAKALPFSALRSGRAAAKAKGGESLALATGTGLLLFGGLVGAGALVAVSAKGGSN